MKSRILMTITFTILSWTDLRAEIDFEREVRPILINKCINCHGGIKAKSGLNFTKKNTVFDKLNSGEIPVVAKSPLKSELFHRITSTDESDKMPPDKPLSQKEINIIKAWIKEGAIWPEHWAYSPLQKKAQNGSSIDEIIVAKLKEIGITQSKIANKRTLLRRLSLDLIGLPPSKIEINNFINDTSENAYEKLVQRLLESKHFGERWARHWLDSARYADSDGYEKDNIRPNAWIWRKWVIDAINNDMPFDQFTIEQISGDLKKNAKPSQVLATAFHRQTLYNREGGVDPEEDRTKRTIDRANTTALVWLGLSLECAQCHDHPYDSLTQKEFYQFYSFFNDMTESEIDYESDFLEKKSKVRVMKRKNRQTFIFHRGDFLQPMKEIKISSTTPSSLPQINANKPKEWDRIDLGNWLVNFNNPLSSRVLANDIWTKLFGASLVQTKSDFGTRSAPPKQLYLLDHLAEKFNQLNWSRKKLIAYIVNSKTYKQSSIRRKQADEKDPDNHFYHRQNRFRIEGEIVRDIFLSSSGLIKHRIGGPSVFPPIPDGVAEQSFAGNFKWKTSQGDDRYRRGMYTFFKRTAPDPNLITFDCPDANVSITKRNISNNPIIALATLGNEVFHEAAQALAKKIIKNLPNDNDRDRIAEAFQLCTSRKSKPEETNELMTLLKKSRHFYSENKEEAKTVIGKYSLENIEAADLAPWVSVSRIILNLDETITRE